MRRKVPLVTGEVYHIFNRGVNKGDIFFSEWDYRRFYLAALHYKTKSTKFSYQQHISRFSSSDPGSELQIGSKIDDNSPPRVEVYGYCFMPNHFHFLLKQLADGGITTFLGNLSNSYSHFVNLKHNRVGPLFQGPFKNVLIKTQEQLLHVSRYIHLNPLVSNLVSDLKLYEPSSYLSYLGREDKLINMDPILGEFQSTNFYEKFVFDQADYGRDLEKIKRLLIDG